ncbi:MAG: CapA family protein [Tissierella sp.]|nr:CapA family protein [Tissierella sp.]
MKKRSLYLIIFLCLLFTMVFKGLGLNPDNVQVVEDNTDIIEEEPDTTEIVEDIIVEPRLTNIDILAVGDIMFHIPQIKSANIGGDEYDFSPVFKHVRKYIQDADLALGNYETVTVGDRAYSGFPRFNSPLETIKGLEDAGFDILSTANNHSLDQGKTGIISTIDAIKGQGLKHTGTNKDKDVEPLIVDVKGIKIGVLSYTYGLNGLDSLLTAEELSYMINLIDEEKIQKEIDLLKNRDVDIILSYIHWGHEYHHQPSDDQINLGRNLVEWGVNIVLGSHPHVVQKSEVIEFNGKDHLIIYSMGNFLSNQSEITMGNSYTEDGVMVKINIEKDLDLEETVIKEIEYIPTWVHRYNEGGKHHYKILPSEDALMGNLDLTLNSSIMKRIEKSYNDVKNVYGDH